MRLSTGAICAIFMATHSAFGAGAILKVSDFGAIPDDGKCDREAFAAAIAEAKKIGASAIEMDAGVYEFQIEKFWSQECITIDSIPNLTFIGKSNSKGRPLTTLLRKYEFVPNKSGTRILSVQNSPNFTLKNVVFDNSPRYMTCGEVVKIDDNGAVVKIPETNPFFDNTVLWCANVWDAKTRNLKKKPSLTFGGANVESRMAELTVKIEGDPKDRLLRVPSAKIASQLEVGEILSWNFGWLGHQVLFNRCDNLRLENVTTHSAIGFCMQASQSRNVYAKNVRFERAGEQMHVGSRDAWKLYCCRGTAVIEDCYFEGVRWDAQNVHGLFAWPESKVDDKTAIMVNDLSGVEGRHFIPGSKVGFWKSKDEEVLLTVVSAKSIEKSAAGKKRAEVVFAESIPDFVDTSTVCSLYGLNLDSYVLLNSTFRNIAGTASLIRNEDVNIIGCSFDNIMYPAICVGGAFSEVEGVNGRNIHIKNNSFDNCGWQSRHGGLGAIAVRIQYSKRTPAENTPFIDGVYISSNTIKNSDIGIDVQDTRNLYITGNFFENVGVPILESKNPEASISDNIVVGAEIVKDSNKAETAEKE